jgi:hypothetical protein
MLVAQEDELRVNVTLVLSIQIFWFFSTQIHIILAT